MSFDVIARDRCRRTVESGPACGFQAFLEEEASVVGASSCWHENKVLARVASQSEGPKMEDQGKALSGLGLTSVCSGEDEFCFTVGRRDGDNDNDNDGEGDVDRALPVWWRSRVDCRAVKKRSMAQHDRAMATLRVAWYGEEAYEHGQLAVDVPPYLTQAYLERGLPGTSMARTAPHYTVPHRPSSGVSGKC
ncbi:hypothetical protein CKAH01_01244 [Colletotrichum kahawae]|uniref:Uncharacterized protein n=1 Tax=Colletotrichum kahawae TaxID=34407 RepID=A0AAE0D403_COLKA|nr:hypothetical protein CKAH01_01244 [Colletotrichum kahawae]